MTLRVAKQFTLPTIYVPGPNEYIPQPAHTEELAAERQANPVGTLVLERQYIGAVTAAHFYHRLAGKKPEDQEDGLNMIAEAALGSARLSFEARLEIAFRRLRLPLLVDLETGRPISADERETRTEQALEHMVSGSEQLYYAMKASDYRKVARNLNVFAKDAGEVAVWMMVQQQPEITANSSSVRIQRDVLKIAANLLHSSIERARELGTNPSLAMLADNNTDWTKHLAGSTNHGTFKAFNEAQIDARSTTPAS